MEIERVRMRDSERDTEKERNSGRVGNREGLRKSHSERQHKGNRWKER